MNSILNLDKDFVKSIFIPDVSVKNVHPEEDIFHVDYNHNSDGFRSPEFDKLNNEKKVLFLGCSHTYGVGLPEEYRFSNILSEKINYKFANISSPGDSVMSQVRKAFWYFRNYGNPKTIICIFPIFRMESPLVWYKNEKSTYVSHDPINKPNYMIENHYFEHNRFKKYAKAPYDLEDVLSQEASIFYSYLYIDILDQYCSSNNINLVWSIWQNQQLFDEITKSEYIPSHKNKITLTSTQIDMHHMSCHSELKSDIFFDAAADRKSGYEPHWGIHKNIHIAEEIYKHIKDMV